MRIWIYPLFFVFIELSAYLSIGQTVQYDDVLYLKNGSVIKGILVEQLIGQSIKIQTKDGNLFVFTESEIDRITREPSGTGSVGIQNSSQIPQVGMQVGGGTVFYVDNGSRTIWISAPFDQAHRQMWGVDGSTMARSWDDGRSNTEMIISFYQTTNEGPSHTAAAKCRYSSISGYNDWYLPAINELEKLHTQRSLVNLSYGIYLSSTEEGRLDFFGIDNRGGRRLVNDFHKDNNDFIIRCIRRQSF